MDENRNDARTSYAEVEEVSLFDPFEKHFRSRNKQNDFLKSLESSASDDEVYDTFSR